MTVRIDKTLWTGSHRQDIDSFDVDCMPLVDLVEYFHNRSDLGDATFEQVSDEHVSISFEISEDSELWIYLEEIRPRFSPSYSIF